MTCGPLSSQAEKRAGTRDRAGCLFRERGLLSCRGQVSWLVDLPDSPERHSGLPNSRTGGQWHEGATLHIQWRDRAGFSPASLGASTHACQPRHPIQFSEGPRVRQPFAGVKRSAPELSPHQRESHRHDHAAADRHSSCARRLERPHLHGLDRRAVERRISAAATERDLRRPSIGFDVDGEQDHPLFPPAQRIGWIRRRRVAAIADRGTDDLSWDAGSMTGCVRIIRDSRAAWGSRWRRRRKD